MSSIADRRPIDRYRFDRRGNVVVDRRRPGPMVGRDEYMRGDRLFAPRRCSPARFAFRAKSRQAAA